jgi:copper(I)-binding protein
LSDFEATSSANIPLVKPLASERRRHAILLLVLAAFVLSVRMTVASAHDYDHGSLHVGHPWSRPTAPGVPMAVAYLSITNHGTKEDVLLGAHTSAAAHVELHQTTISNGMASMRPLAQIAIDPGQTLHIEPGGIHLMLVDVKTPFVEGKNVPLTLEFRDAGFVDVELEVESRDASPAAK